MKKLTACLALCLGFAAVQAQRFSEKTPEALRWADSVFATLTPEMKVAQTMIIRAHSNLGADHVAEVERLIRRYNVGGLCFFQGGPVRQARLTNQYQAMAKTPLMVAIDGEWGLGMRLDSVINYPRQLMMGAMQNAGLVYEFGRAVGQQCRRIGIHVNYAPDVDVNNNPLNPVINDRSFGEDKYKVSLMGIAYMRGMQDLNVMACAKHFPGHGDVTADSHYDLPVINKSRPQLDTLELYPFREMIKAGVGSFMIAHLFIPSIDTLSTQPTSLSIKNVTGLLRNELGYQGITFTDGMEMQGIRKHYRDADANLQALIAGNDMLCLPADVDKTIPMILAAVADGRLPQAALDEKVRKILIAKYHLGLNQPQVIDTRNLTADLNAATLPLRRQLSEQSVTMVNLEDEAILPIAAGKKVLYVGLGLKANGALGQGLRAGANAQTILMDYRDSAALGLLSKQCKGYDLVVVGLHNYSRRPAGNYGIPPLADKVLKQLQKKSNVLYVAFGNPYVLGLLPDAENVMACYEDDSLTQKAALEVLMGRKAATGRLPVTVSPRYPYGSGMDFRMAMPVKGSREAGFRRRLLRRIDGIVEEAIAQRATPGAVVLAAHNGSIGWLRAYGNHTYDSADAVTTEAVYDLASVTKVTATTMAVMKLYESGRLTLDAPASQYLAWLRGTNKEKITVRQLLQHQGGLVSFIPFYRETIDTSSGIWKPGYYRMQSMPGYTIPVADNMFLRNDYLDTIRQRIITSRVQPPDTKYVYSDNDFILLGKIVEALSGQTLDQYCTEQFFRPLQMSSTCFNPHDNLPLNRYVPTEREKIFRNQLIDGYVHDPGAAMMGGVAGHAGLFSSARDLAVLYQLLLNKGSFNGETLLQPATIEMFTAYQSSISRRGLGFDKPEKDNATRKEPYPAGPVSSATFGHTGFTGTCVWADPASGLLYIFLSNRVHPDGSNKLLQMNVRSRVHEAIYRAVR